MRSLQYEDTVDEDRNHGIEALMAQRERLKALTVDLSETEAYSKTLQHMLRRSEDEKLSELAQLKAYEDALTVHRAELELAEDVQRQVTKARDEELRALQKLHLDVRTAVTTLDKKLEGRRLEVKIRQDKAKYRLLKLQEEMALKSAAEGILTPEQELAMVEKARANAIEHDSLRMEKLTVVAEADQLEAEFVSLRFAAGWRPEGAEGGAAGAAKVEEDTFARPDPEPIINRLAQLEEEIHSIDETLRENVALLQIQQQQRGVLSVIKQPRATDALDEVDQEVDAIARLQARTEDAKRSFEASHRDLESTRSLRLHLEQSLASLGERVGALPPLHAQPPNTPAERAYERALAELEAVTDRMSSAWARKQSRAALELMRRMHKLVQTVDPMAGAAGALAASDAWERSETGAAAALARPAEQAELGALSREGGGGGGAGGAEDEGGEGGEELSPEERAAQEAERAAAEQHEALQQAATDKRIEATIESLLVQNEWSVRVRPGSSGPSRPFRSITGKTMTDAVAAFERTWRGAAGAPPEAGAWGAQREFLSLRGAACAWPRLRTRTPQRSAIATLTTRTQHTHCTHRRRGRQRRPLWHHGHSAAAQGHDGGDLWRLRRHCSLRWPDGQDSRGAWVKGGLRTAAAAPSSRPAHAPHPHPPPPHTPPPPLRSPSSPRCPWTCPRAPAPGTFSATWLWLQPWWATSWRRARCCPRGAQPTSAARRLRQRRTRSSTCATRSSWTLPRAPRLWRQRPRGQRRRQPWTTCQ